MEKIDFSDMPVLEIMRRWPATVSVFVSNGMYCVGCPIGGFHTLEDAAREHGLSYPELEAQMIETILAQHEYAVHKV